MSAVTDATAAEQGDLDAISAVLDSITTGIAALDAQIIAFDNSPGTLSPADQAALTAIKTSSAALLVKAQAISTAPPVNPNPAP